MKVPLPAVEVVKNCVLPPPADLAAPPLLVKVPLPAVEVSKNSVGAPPEALAMAPLFVNAPPAALELLLKSVAPGLPETKLVKDVLFPAVALLTNWITPS